jgi:hypothetical protein
MSRTGFRAARVAVLHCGHCLGLPGDQVELVAFDVGEGRPAGLVSPQVAEPVGTRAQQAFGLGVEGIAG